MKLSSLKCQMLMYGIIVCNVFIHYYTLVTTLPNYIHIENMVKFALHPDIPVFYNVYTKNANNAAAVTNIVEDQFANLRPHHKVFVRSIGAPLPIFKTKNTTVLRHDQEGNESQTLSLLWQYCQDHPKEKVVYIHSKGSFHPNPTNELLRKYVTKGALSDECTHLPSACNVCATRMSPVPHPHTSGNMWLARCEYVKKLIDPNLFEEAMNRVKYEDMYSKRKYCVGKGRYSAEHWIYSHPTVVPCDLHRNSTFVWGYANDPIMPGYDFKPELKLAPRFTLDAYLVHKGCGKWGTLLQDRLVEYQSLYGEQPSESWWGWNLYAK